ncbi:HAMP domain-containing histidine kinase [Microvenator marinus]|uniref:histidine kinase n=1 Tax=Microvenator marinus TaxID=2600177 RepID=A0A5B8XS53_9DELT|nr:HAMP domain-containing sensor histidine kinase [Microvenator marinus]QED28081.1 HAMP domain-containing histidine kinase [Microvenator marinus]
MRPLSLRTRTLLVVCVVVFVPVLFTWLTSPFEEAIEHSMRRSLKACTQDAIQLVRVQSPNSRYQELAESCSIWIRVFSPDGTLEADANGLGEPSWRERILFAPDPVPTLIGVDPELPPLSERSTVKTAEARGQAGICHLHQNGRLFICEYARHVELATQSTPRIIHAQSSSSRSLSNLYAERGAIMRLSLLVMLVAIVLGIWLSWRLTKPLGLLRDAVRERTVPVVSTSRIEVVGDDEVAELGHAFNDLLSALDTKNQANEAFMADMAHEIKNPVAAIRAVSESLERRPEVDAERAERLAKILKDSSARLDAVVNRFLELARAESGLPRADKSEVRVDELVKNIVESFSTDERYTAIEFDLASFKATVLGSAAHLETVVRNLVANAASFAKTAVRVRVERREDWVVIEVSDDGKGIAEDDLPRVFDRFFTRRDDGGGTGLGLAMVLALTRAHGGKVRVESEVGKGSTFIVELPALTGLSS